MKTFIALITFVQYGELQSYIRHVQAKSWEEALDMTAQILEETYREMQADGVTAIQLQSLTITNP